MEKEPKLTVPSSEVATRRSSARRMAWGIGGFVLLIYLLGFMVERG